MRLQTNEDGLGSIDIFQHSFHMKITTTNRIINHYSTDGRNYRGAIIDSDRYLAMVKLHSKITFCLTHGFGTSAAEGAKRSCVGGEDGTETIERMIWR